MEEIKKRPLSFREKATLLILIGIAQMIVRVLNFADFKLELESDFKEVKRMINEDLDK